MSKPKDYQRNVFINCPFDDAYFKLLQVLIFTIRYFDFYPKIALIDSDSGTSRLEKIIRLIKESKFAIHDLSRLRAKSVDEFYRLNMPFELGLEYGLRRFGPDYADKRSLILETLRFDYRKAISDLSGFDIKSHNDNPVQLIECLRSWFADTVGIKNLNSSDKIYFDFIGYNEELFKRKIRKYRSEHTVTESEKFARKEIQEMTVSEYISEINWWVNSGKNQ